jgi:hypothetical protein
VSRAVTKVSPGHFRVDFVGLDREERSWIQKVLAFGTREPVEVDPYLIALAVRRVMRLCKVRDHRGQTQVWNEYTIFLSRPDYHRILPLADGLRAGLDTVIHETLGELQAEMVGDPTVRIRVDELNEVPQAMGDFVVAFVKNHARAPSAAGEVTVRLTRDRPRQRPPRESPRPRHEPPPAAGVGALCLAWGGREVAVPAVGKVLVGRPHSGAPANFVALDGASQRISSLHLAIDAAADGVVISRPRDANPVTVDGRPIQAGGKLSVPALPVEISLSNGEMVLQLKRCGSR